MGSRWKLALLGLLALVGVTGLALEQTRAEPLFFLRAPEAERVEAIVETGSAGLIVYFRLLARDGRETRDDGRVELVVVDGRGVLYRTSRRVRRNDFAQVRLAGGEGWSWSCVSGFGWLGYREKLASPAAGPGRVEITFSTGRGKALHSAVPVTFPG